MSPSLRQTYRRIRFEPVKESDAALSNCDDESVSCRGKRVKVEGEAGTWAVIKFNYFNNSGWLGVDDRVGVTTNDFLQVSR